MTSNSPIPLAHLEALTKTACTNALASATTYTHAQTAGWNSAIISTLLQSLIAEASPEGKYKFAVTSTIIQHLLDPSPSSTSGSEGEAGQVGRIGGGRRGMHSASGAYWNEERDGMWSWKFEGAEGKGMDVVVSVMWIGV